VAAAKELARELSARFPGPLSLKLERVLCPFLLAQVNTQEFPHPVDSAQAAARSLRARRTDSDTVQPLWSWKEGGGIVYGPKWPRVMAQSWLVVCSGLTIHECRCFEVQMGQGKVRQ